MQLSLQKDAETQTIKDGRYEGENQVGVSEKKRRRAEDVRESYSLIVLRDGKADHMGKG